MDSFSLDGRLPACLIDGVACLKNRLVQINIYTCTTFIIFILIYWIGILDNRTHFKVIPIIPKSENIGRQSKVILYFYLKFQQLQYSGLFKEGHLKITKCTALFENVWLKGLKYRNTCQTQLRWGSITQTLWKFQ